MYACRAINSQATIEYTSAVRSDVTHPHHHRLCVTEAREGRVRRNVRSKVTSRTFWHPLVWLSTVVVASTYRCAMEAASVVAARAMLRRRHHAAMPSLWDQSAEKAAKMDADSTTGSRRYGHPAHGWRERMAEGARLEPFAGSVAPKRRTPPLLPPKFPSRAQVSACGECISRRKQSHAAKAQCQQQMPCSSVGSSAPTGRPRYVWEVSFYHVL